MPANNGWAAAASGQAMSEGENTSGIVDNRNLVPKLEPDSKVTMIGGSPDWVKSLIVGEFRIETATPEGTFASATRVLDHYAEMGVNGLWIPPIWQRGSNGRGYGNFGPHLVEPFLTGTAATNFSEVKKFVAAAHQRNIRVFFDIVVWGTRSNATLVVEHPEFYSREKDGSMHITWGGYGFNWKNPELKKWFTEAAVNFILETDADGYRVDLAPRTGGYYFREVREQLYAKGRKVVIISESPNERLDTYDFEQTGTGSTEEPDFTTPEIHAAQKARVGRPFQFLLNNNIVDAVKSGHGIGKPSLQQQPGGGGRFRYYTSVLLCHDDHDPAAEGNRVRFAYGTIFAPFIPLWWIGEEWNNPKKLLPVPGSVMYFNTIDWSQLEVPEHRAFYEDIKKYIRIRRNFPEIFEYFPEHHREVNIAKVESRLNKTPNGLQAYGRFAGNKAVVVVPNYQATQATAEVVPDYTALGLGSASSYTVTDLMTAKIVKTGPLAQARSFTSDIEPNHLGIYLIEGLDK